jgi:transcriptional regulator with XRE-family HTH domain
MTVKNMLFEYWKNEELRRGELIEIKDVAKATGLHRETVSNLLRGETTRFDTPVLEKICKFFNIPAGPVPFIVYEPDPE